MADAPATGIGVNSTTSFKFASVDELGNVEETKLATYVIDREPPAVTLSQTPGASYDQNFEVELTINNIAAIYTSITSNWT